MFWTFCVFLLYSLGEVGKVEILYADTELIACVKPVGMDSEHALPQALAAGLGGKLYPVSRLDQNVGGVMVFARTREAAAALSAAVQRGELSKAYVARVHGIPPEQGTWTDLLFKDGRSNKVFVVKRVRAGVREAKLAYTRLTDTEPCLVRIRLYTGRSHQIRVQFASRGFPLVGDHKYGARDKADAPMLFCSRVQLPWHGETRVFEALPPWA